VPTYEYKCENDHRYVEVKSINSRDDIKSCKEPDCGGKVSRIFSASPIIFNGGGFSSTRG